MDQVPGMIVCIDKQSAQQADGAVELTLEAGEVDGGLQCAVDAGPCGIVPIEAALYIREPPLQL